MNKHHIPCLEHIINRQQISQEYGQRYLRAPPEDHKVVPEALIGQAQLPCLATQRIGELSSDNTKEETCLCVL